MQDQIITTARADAKFLKRELEMQKAIREEEKAKNTPILPFQTITKDVKASPMWKKAMGMPIQEDENINQKSPDTQGSKTTRSTAPDKGPIVNSSLPKYPSAELRPYKKFTTRADAIKYANKIGVSFLDPKFTLEQMNLILREYTESLSSGYPITDSVIAKKYDPKVGLATAGISKNNDSFYAYIEEPYWSNPDSIAKEYNKVYPDYVGTWHSTADAGGTVNHELGHNFQKKYYPVSFTKCNTFITDSDYDLLRANLSEYAVSYYEDDEKTPNQDFTRTCREIVAEVHARLAAKEWVHPEVMEIYQRILKNEN